MAISRRDIVQMLRDENELLKLRNQQISDKLARQQQALRAISEMESLLNHPLNMGSIDLTIKHLLSLVLHASNSDNGSLLLIDEETDELVFVEVVGESAELLKNQRMDKTQGIVGSALKHRRAVLVDDVKKSYEWTSSIDERVGFSTKSLMCAPLLVGNKPLGAIEVVNTRNDESFEEIDLSILSITARFLALILDEAET